VIQSLVYLLLRRVLGVVRSSEHALGEAELEIAVLHHQLAVLRRQVKRPVYRTSEDPAGELASCHTEALRVADELGARTVAFPAISTGAFGYPLEEAAAVAVRAVRGADTRVEEVRFVLFGREAFDAFERALGR